MAKVRFYETMIVVKPDLTEDQRNAMVEKVKNFIEVKVEGKIQEEKRWGMRKLAYKTPHGKYTEGDYAYFIYEADPEKVNLLENFFKITQDVMRFMTLRREDLEKKL